MVEAYNPLDKFNLGKSVVEALLATDAVRIEDVTTFEGAGIYAIYYNGSNSLYQSIRKSDSSGVQRPIYVGKAVPSGARRGSNLATSSSGRALFNRIADHRESLRAVTNLDVRDFSVRYLIVDDIWIPLGESLLISSFNPVWNRLIDGFGNHDPGAGRYNGLRPLWDVLHPGRPWADRCKVRTETQDDIAKRVIDHFENESKVPGA